VQGVNLLFVGWFCFSALCLGACSCPGIVSCTGEFAATGTPLPSQEQLPEASLWRWRQRHGMAWHGMNRIESEQSISKGGEDPGRPGIYISDADGDRRSESGIANQFDKLVGMIFIY
jgi:hypothetical protein